MHGVRGRSIQLCVHGGMPGVRSRIDDEHTGEQWRQHVHGVRGWAEQCIGDGGVCIVRGGPIPGQCSTHCLPTMWRRLDDGYVEWYRGRELHSLCGRAVQHILRCSVCAVRGRPVPRCGRSDRV
jgi:hypothetical protein